MPLPHQFPYERDQPGLPRAFHPLCMQNLAHFDEARIDIIVDHHIIIFGPVADFASGILQTHSIGATFGTSFSSGAISYGGGDSGAIFEQQLEELLKELEKNRTT